MLIRSARADELEALGALCLRSKAVWGYDCAFMEACRAELTLTPADLDETEICVAQRGGAVIGVAQISVEGNEAQLEKLFVEPGLLRSGVGRALFAWAREAALEQGATVLVVDADPDAAAFYRKMGARDDGVAPSGSIPGRFLPRLRFDL